AILGSASTIGNGCRLGHGTVLGDWCVVASYHDTDLG
ncbi:MAG: hypothetical protein GY773_02525, partial [Actinomycetia bacterium]|nr:hypothetical protein [Actinomycetes bacterium]